ncbi:MAG: MotA/TolQ/ExbB proton channel family protein [Pseudomonadota bacterium]|nr:MotA/TolQ/ExbB proton channel family protein [Pseudomonadota bacterium]|tara:strand:+ start:4127 stop:5500 length:1374 start_codon:yes stop_codon:yes gene_type:complete
MNNLKFLLVFASLLINGFAFSQSSDESLSLNDLLQLVEQGRASDNATENERLARFRSDQSVQESMLQDGLEQKASEERRSGILETTFEENELLIADVQEQLDTRLGSLRELFGVLQQVAGDARSQFDNSLTNVEYPGRSEFLSDLAAKMGSSSQLATIEEIERLWFELQREATEQGKIKLIPDFRVITQNGEESFENIVRVGTFNVVADGRYLSHNPDTNTLSELQRQPEQGRFTGSTSDIVRASSGSGVVSFGLDPTSGIILSALVETPNLAERIGQGGIVGYVIITLGLLGVLLSLERLYSLTMAGRRVSAQLKQSTPTDDNALGRVLMVYDNNKNADTETLELKLGEAILKETPALQRGILFIKVISVVAPLMGLLGTVTGMINTFQAITLFGTGDPKTMAGGISQALVTTVLGLTVAIPTVLLHTVVSGRSKSITQVLQEQSAGLVAEQSEKS